MFRKIRRKLHWKDVFKKVKPYASDYPLIILKTSLEDLLEEALDFMFMPEIETMCFELIETISNINLMVLTDNEDEYKMLKHRVMYMLNNRLESWYI